jgi:hypothetical protein
MSSIDRADMSPLVTVGSAGMVTGSGTGSGGAGGRVGVEPGVPVVAGGGVVGRATGGCFFPHAPAKPKTTTTISATDIRLIQQALSSSRPIGKLVFAIARNLPHAAAVAADDRDLRLPPSRCRERNVAAGG